MAVSIKIKQKPTSTIINEYVNPVEFSQCKNSGMVEDILQGWFHQNVINHTMHDDIPKIVNPNSKWRVTSCMQKAIRRGDAIMAMRMASALVVHDPVYFLSRINVIALEDIGLGNILTTASIFAFSGKEKTLDAQYGLVRVAQFWVKSFALGVKDRSLCDLVAMTEYGPKYAGLRADLSHTDYTYIEDTKTIKKMMDDTESMVEKTIILRYLSGTDRYKADTYLPKEGSYKLLMDFYWEYTPPLIAYIAQRGSKKSVYCMWQHLYVIYEWINNNEPPQIVNVKMPHTIPIRGVMSYAYDMHTQEGKRAYAYFIKSCEPIAAYLKKHDFKFANMAGPAFIADTGICDKLINYSQLQELYKLAFEAEFMSCGLTLNQGYELVHLIQNNLHELDKARYRIVTNEHYVEASTSNEPPFDPD